jgi:hypothetical protein
MRFASKALGSRTVASTIGFPEAHAIAVASARCATPSSVRSRITYTPDSAINDSHSASCRASSEQYASAAGWVVRRRSCVSCVPGVVEGIRWVERIVAGATHGQPTPFLKFVR